MPTCLRCRRETAALEDGSVALRLDGPELLAAIRTTPREELDAAQRELLDRLAAGLCPTCGRSLD